MTFDATGLLVFLLAIVPGFVAQQSRHSIVPRSVQKKSVIEETGEYVLNSVFIHAFLLIASRLVLILFDPLLLIAFNNAVQHRSLSQWAWAHHYFVLLYFIISLIIGIFVGLVRGVISLNQPVRNRLLNYKWFRWTLVNIGIYSFLQEEPVWYGVLRQGSKNELTFVQIRMKENGGVFTGELKNFAILGDSEREKDFYLVNVYYRAANQEKFGRLNADGVLLNFSDVQSIEIAKGPAPSKDASRANGIKARPVTPSAADPPKE